LAISNPTRRTRGFTLLEVMIAMALGLLVLAGAVMMYKDGLNASWMVTQRSEMQLEVRSAQNMLTRDIRRAGFGLGSGGVALVTGASRPIYGCDQNKCYVPAGNANPAGIQYPYAPSSTTPWMYWLLPGYKQSAVINNSIGANDAITVVYSDQATNFYSNLANYTIAFNNANGTSMTFTLKPSAQQIAPVRQLSDPVYGLKVGDLIYFTNSKAGVVQTAVGEVTTAPTGNSPYTVLFGDPDKLLMNQAAGTSSGLKQLATGTTTTATRIYVVTYYIDAQANPSGNGNPTPRLMRQISGQTPYSISEYIVDLHFNYEFYDINGTVSNSNGTTGLLNQLQRVDVNMTARSSLQGINGYQGIQMNWTVGAQNLSFSNQYPQ